jgi:hypothetical protein
MNNLESFVKQGVIFLYVHSLVTFLVIYSNNSGVFSKNKESFNSNFFKCFLRFIKCSLLKIIVVACSTLEVFLLVEFSKYSLIRCLGILDN